MTVDTVLLVALILLVLSLMALVGFVALRVMRLSKEGVDMDQLRQEFAGLKTQEPPEHLMSQIRQEFAGLKAQDAPAQLMGELGQLRASVTANKESDRQVANTISRIETQLTERQNTLNQTAHKLHQALTLLQESKNAGARTADSVQRLEQGQALAQQMSQQVQQALTLLHESRVRENRTADSVQRLEAVLAGTQSRGSAGENLVEAAFAKLPTQWQARNVRMGVGVVEFGLKIPGGRIIPIDSKWPARRLIEEFATCDDPQQRAQLKAQINQAVLSKASELQKYLDPGRTPGFGIAAVPDTAFDLCAEARIGAMNMGVALVSYSMLIPYLLLAFQVALHTATDIEMDRVRNNLHGVKETTEKLQSEVEGRFSRALAMLQNSRDELRGQFGRINTSIAIMEGTSSEAEQQSIVLEAPAAHS